MSSLDAITVFFLGGIAQLGLAAGLWLLKFSADDRVLSRLWLASQICGGLGMVLLLGRRNPNLFLFSTMANALIVAGMALHVMAVRRFFSVYGRVVPAVLCVALVLQFVLRPMGLADNVRLSVTGMCVLVMMGELVRLFWRYRRMGFRATEFLLGVNALVFLLVFARLLETLTADDSYTFFNAGVGQSLGIIGLFIHASLNGMGFALLMKERAGNELQRLATLDSLTEVSNRRSFLETVQVHLRLAGRRAYPVSLLICDLDHFKHINDAHGHSAGDEVIRALVSVMRSCVRGSDLIGRWGGEEFVVLLPSTDLDGARQLAERMREAFAAHPVILSGQSVAATVSVGVAEHLEAEDIQRTLDRADAALYRAKHAGRNRVEVAMAAASNEL